MLSKFIAEQTNHSGQGLTGVLEKKDAYFLPECYQYFDILTKHLGTEVHNIAFNQTNTEPVYPRQLEIHLGNDKLNPCNLSCSHCQGSEVNKTNIDNSSKSIELIKNLDGKIPYFIFGGVFSEPLLNKNIFNVLNTVKETGTNFGIHTNGTLLYPLQRRDGFISRLAEIADQNDYITISIDSGSAQSFSLTKNVRPLLYENIKRAIDFYKNINEKTAQQSFKLKLTYLLNEHNSSPEELAGFVRYAKNIGPTIASLRFSIPYAVYGQSMEKCKDYKLHHEIPFFENIRNTLEPLLDSESLPQIIFLPPENQDVDKLNFKHCFYTYYQLTYAADGYFYPCSSSATSSFKHLRLGQAPDNLDDFNKILYKTQAESFNPQEQCLKKDVRCCRMAISINNIAEGKKYGTVQDN